MCIEPKLFRLRLAQRKASVIFPNSDGNTLLARVRCHRETPGDTVQITYAHTSD